jgi:hypothetical protein
MGGQPSVLMKRFAFIRYRFWRCLALFHSRTGVGDWIIGVGMGSRSVKQAIYGDADE